MSYKIKSVDLRKCPYYRYLTKKSDVRIRNTSQSLIYSNMAEKQLAYDIMWRNYVTVTLCTELCECLRSLESLAWVCCIALYITWLCCLYCVFSSISRAPFEMMIIVSLMMVGFYFAFYSTFFDTWQQSVFLLVHGQVTIIFVVSVGLSVCLCRVFLSRLWSDFDHTRTHVICLGLLVSPRI